MNTYKLAASGLLAAVAVILQVFNSLIGLPTGFGMTVDLVGVPVLLAFFVLGYESALLVSVLVALVISLISPTGYIGAVMKFTATLPMFLLPAAVALSFSRKGTGAGAIASAALAVSLVLVSVFALSAYSSVFAGSVTSENLAAGLLPVVVLALSALIFKTVWKVYGNSRAIGELSSLQVAGLALAAAILVRGVVMVVTNLYFAGPLFFKTSPAEFIAFVQQAQLPFLGAVPWYAIIFFWNAVQGVVEFAIAWLVAFKFGFAKKYSLQ